MTQTTQPLDPLQLRHGLKLARIEIATLRSQNNQLRKDLAEEMSSGAPTPLGRLTGPCLVALMLSGTFWGTTTAIARGLSAFNVQLPAVQLELPQRGER